MTVTVQPPEPHAFHATVRACAREFTPFCDSLAPRYHPSVIQAALLVAGAEVMAWQIAKGYLKPQLARRILLSAWRHAFAGCRRRLGRSTWLHAAVTIFLVLVGCSRPVQVLERTTADELIATAPDLEANRQRDGAWIDYEPWLREFCKLPAEERAAQAREARRSEPNCAILSKKKGAHE